MNKILNWTFGDCFRTLGRFLAIFLILALFLFIGSKLGIKIPLFGAIHVNASEEKVYQYVLNGWGSSYSPTNYYSTDANWYTVSMTDNLYSYFSPVFTQSYLGYTPKKLVFTIRFEGQQDFIYNYSSAFDAFVKENLIINLHTYSPNGTNSPCTVIGSFGNVFTVSCPVIENTVSIDALNFRYSTSYYGNSILFTPTIGLSGIVLSYTYDSTEQQILTDISNTQQQINDKLDDVNNSINNSDTTGANDSASSFFNNFSTNTFGLTSIITTPLSAINSLISSTCSDLVLPIPFVNKNLKLPCMSSIYNEYFGSFFDIYQIITTGLISYYVIVRIFNLVKDFKNPSHDEIEVLDL